MEITLDPEEMTEMARLLAGAADALVGHAGHVGSCCGWVAAGEIEDLDRALRSLAFDLTGAAADLHRRADVVASDSLISASTAVWGHDTMTVGAAGFWDQLAAAPAVSAPPVAFGEGFDAGVTIVGASSGFWEGLMAPSPPASSIAGKPVGSLDWGLEFILSGRGARPAAGFEWARSPAPLANTSIGL